ncbi:Retrovirus-related Pol polyprotein from transposon TNT 1-94, partial [Erysiphe neolycopersici]
MITYENSDSYHADIFDTNLFKAFEVRHITNSCSFLGIRIVRNRNDKKLCLCQDNYIESLASTFNIVTTKSPKTPISQNTLLPFEGTASMAQIKGYQQKVGKVNFAAITTRPDIARAVSIMSRFLVNPGPQHLEAIDHLLHYLISTPHLAICYNGNYFLQNSISTKRAFMTFRVASYGDDPETRHSSCGFALLLYGGIVHYKATKQKTVTTSSTEAELLAVSILAKEYLWW